METVDETQIMAGPKKEAIKGMLKSFAANKQAPELSPALNKKYPFFSSYLSFQDLGVTINDVTVATPENLDTVLNVVLSADIKMLGLDTECDTIISLLNQEETLSTVQLSCEIAVSGGKTKTKHIFIPMWELNYFQAHKVRTAIKELLKRNEIKKIGVDLQADIRTLLVDSI